MLNKKEIDASVVTLVKSKQDKSFLSKSKERVRFAVDGTSDLGLKSKISEENTVAIATPSTVGGMTYQVKSRRGGYLYNPLDDGKLGQRDKVTNDMRFRFRTVSHKSFDHYISFLKTRNRSSLIKAQREI